MSRKSILDLAAEAVAERRKTYGPPAEHWQRTVDIINGAFSARVRARLDASEAMFVVEDWPIIMSLDKISRELGSAMHRDNPVDISGYLHGRDEILCARADETMSGLARVISQLAEMRSCPLHGAREHDHHEWTADFGDGERLYACIGWRDDRVPCPIAFDPGENTTVSWKDGADDLKRCFLIECDGFAGHDGSHTGTRNGRFFSW